MNTLKNILFSAALLLLGSCEKVVYIDLNSGDPKIVVEANISDQPGPYHVKLSNSVNYYDDNIFPGITGARVIIYDDKGQLDTLMETSAGSYQTVKLMGIPGRVYHLMVSTKEGKAYHSSSVMNAAVPIDSILYEPTPRKNNYRLICKFRDTEFVENYYKLQAYSNNPKGLDSTNIRVLSDRLTDGQEMTVSYRTSLLQGDSITLKLESIDKGTYDFYRTFPNVGGGLDGFLSAPPANPITNVDNGALGYFSAHGVSTKSDVVHY